MKWTAKQRKALNQAIRRLKASLSADDSITDILIPKDLLLKIDPSTGRYAEQLRENVEIKVKRVVVLKNKRIGSEEVIYKLKDIYPYIQKANRAEAANKRLKKANPKRYKEAQEAGLTQRRTVGSILPSSDPAKTLKQFGRTAAQRLADKDKRAIDNLKKSIESTNLPNELKDDIKKALRNGATKNGYLEKIRKKELSSETLSEFYSSTSELINDVLAELLDSLNIDLSKKWDNKTLEEIRAEM